MLRYWFIFCLGFLLSCQTRSSQEASNSFPKEDTQASLPEDAPVVTLASSYEQLLRDAERIQQLRLKVYNELDSLYQLTSDPQVQLRIDSLEAVYFRLSDVDEAFTVWNNQQNTNYDSLELTVDSAAINQEKIAFQHWSDQLTSRISDAETLLRQ